jgi:alpha-D-ribose 1-methylphosphonate 5-triphosphate synthase subunit PhnH
MNVADTSALRDPVRDSQGVFRAVMNALAHPMQPFALSCTLVAPAGISPAAAAVLLTLADFETSFWLDEPAAEPPRISAYLRFHTGAKQATSADTADFALVADASRLAPLAQFSQGAHEYPDRSTTLIIEVPNLLDHGWICTGPGIDGTRSCCVSGLPADFVAQWTDNVAAFPLGVDILFVCGQQIAGLPRTTRIQEA